MTLDDLEQAMGSQYRIVKGRKGKTNNSKLSLTGFDGKFYKCNKVGYRANTCPDGNTDPSKGGRYTGPDKRGKRFIKIM